MSDFSLMVTCVGGGLSAQFVRLLKQSSRHKIKVIGVDVGRAPVARHFVDAFEIVPHGSDPSYSEAILQVCKKYSVNLVFPCSDEEALSLSSYKSRFISEDIHVACNDRAALDIISDKSKTYDYLKSIGIRTPEWYVSNNPEDILGYFEKIIQHKQSVVVKGASDRGGRGVFVVDNSASDVKSVPGSHELHMGREKFLSEFFDKTARSGKTIVMERLFEPVHDFDILAWQGDIKAYVPRRRLVSSAPNQGHEIVSAPEMYQIGKMIVKDLNLSWLFDIDFMFDSRGKPMVLEVNPRASGSVSVGMVAGMPLVDDMISLVLGEPVPPRTPPVGEKVVASSMLVKL